MLLASGGSGPVPPNDLIGVIRDSKIAPATATASFTLNTDGTISKVGNASLADANWYLPTTVGAGNNYWCRLVNVGGGLALNVGLTFGTIYALTTFRQFGYTQVGIGIRTTTARLEIATDAGMANIVSSNEFMLEAVSEP